MTDLLTPPIVVPANCHPHEEHYARGLCRGCYDHHRHGGTLVGHPRRNRTAAEFAADYAQLRDEGYRRVHIAARLGMRTNTVDAAYRRAVAAGLLTPDRRTA